MSKRGFEVNCFIEYLNICEKDFYTMFINATKENNSRYKIYSFKDEIN